MTKKLSQKQLERLSQARTNLDSFRCKYEKYNEKRILINETTAGKWQHKIKNTPAIVKKEQNSSSTDC